MSKQANALQTQKQVKINGKVYTLQMQEALWYLELVDRCKDKDGNLMTSKYMSELLPNVVASPRIKINDFTGRVYELRALSKECEKFLMGEDFDPEEDEEFEKSLEGKTAEEKNGYGPQENNKPEENGFVQSGSFGGQ